MRAEGSLVRKVSGAGTKAEYSYTLSFADGRAQIARDGLLFEAETSPEAFLALSLPQKLFDPDKYYIVRFGEEADTVLFEDARDTETTWLGMECTDVTAGNGTAKFDGAGRLSEQTYTAEYALEGVQLRAEAKLNITEGQKTEAAEREEGTPVGDLRTVLLSDLAADMLQTETLSATFLRLMRSELAAKAVMQQGWTGIDGASLLRDDLQQVSYNGFSTSSSSREARYQDGKWTIIQNSKKTERERTARRSLPGSARA